MQIVQIVSRLPPAICGVGDYACLLARELRATHDIHTTFVVCDTDWGKAESGKLPSEVGETTLHGAGKAESEKRTEDSTPHPIPLPERGGEGGAFQLSTLNFQPSTLLDGFPVFQIKERSAQELLRVLSAPGMPQTVLLQYVGYGYEKRGCPLWLARGLRAWRGSGNALRQAPSAKRLVTMFHELYAFGPPWRSSFWTSPLQRGIAKSLARLSDHCLTNRAAAAAELAAMSRSPIHAIPALPVFSNLGEPESVLPLASRKPQMLVYGGLSHLPKDYDLAVKAIQRVYQRVGIEQLTAFGSKTLDSSVIGLPVKNVGVLSKTDGSRLLQESRLGYLDYFDGYLAKSGVFAAYCAHGLVPLLLRNNHSEADGLELGKHFWTVTALPSETGVVAQQNVADQAHKWYGRHSVTETASAFADKLKSNVNLLVEA